MICDLEVRVLGGMQFGVLVDAVLRVCEIDGRVLGGTQFGVLGEVLFCESDGRVLGGMQFGVLVRCCFASLRAGCYGACSLGR